jgi:capsular polysaccharide biosynthesis protein
VGARRSKKRLRFFNTGYYRLFRAVDLQTFELNVVLYVAVAVLAYASDQKLDQLRSFHGLMRNKDFREVILWSTHSRTRRTWIMRKKSSMRLVR